MKNVVALILAGGQGTRLYDLTAATSKPAVEFGAKYRIIDFVLSSCSHSGIRNVGVITQYEPLELNRYVNNGKTWDLDFEDGGLHILPPFATSDENTWFKGTAHAIHANIKYIESLDVDYVLILSGDHIYSMDYEKVIDAHVQSKSELTICVKPVPIEEASRFGIMETDSDNKIIEFYEKPEEPKSNLASMGIYVFNKEVLKEYLKKEELVEETEFDFGKNIIPAIIDAGLEVSAYPFDGYWKDVGTIDSLWDANMDLLNNQELINDKSWPIYSHTPDLIPSFYDNSEIIKRSIINEGSLLAGEIEDSVISYNCMIEEDVKLKKVVVHSNVTIKKGSKIKYAIVASNTIVPHDTVIEGSKDNIILVTNKMIMEAK